MPTRPDRMLMVSAPARLVRKAVEAGFRVWSVWDPALREEAEHREVARYAEEVLTADLADEPALRALMVRTVRDHRIGCVMYLGDGAGLRPVLEEAHELGLNTNPPQAHRLIGDRAALRELLRGHGRLGARFLRVERADELCGAAEELGGHPVVLDSLAERHSSAEPCRVLAHDAEAVEAWAARTPGPYLVEEFLSGPRYVAGTISVEGMHQVVGITATTTSGPPHFVAVEHLHPAPLGAREEAEVRSAVCALLDLAGFEHGPVETTVVLTDTGARIASARPGFVRDGISLLLRLTCGIDLETEFFRTLLSGGCLPRTDAVRTAATGFFRLPPGRLTAVTGLDELRALPHVHAVRFPFRPGNLIPSTTSRATRHGYVVVDGAGAGETAERLAAARSLLRARVVSAP